ncbi:hypothetical protein AVEN_186606-1 [Araneus ventricosus]|uniref:Uncharacterized protein n=1 Tax=Araneus ventricosus TaxID=182803 RepID=A0A4Y2K216_ARAVE|nr:hypothetical protein AVEN_186606-1 [Araneus ventricosus]
MNWGGGRQPSSSDSTYLLREGLGRGAVLAIRTRPQYSSLSHDCHSVKTRVLWQVGGCISGFRLDWSRRCYSIASMITRPYTSGFQRMRFCETPGLSSATSEIENPNQDCT